MFLLVSKLKMIGMLLNVAQGQVQQKLTKTYNKGFPNHSTLINYACVRHHHKFAKTRSRITTNITVFREK